MNEIKQNFLSPGETATLFSACASLTFKRKTPYGKPARHATVAFSSRPDEHQKTIPLADAPDAIKRLAQRLTEHAGKEINYLAVVLYRDGDDYFPWHQHKSDKRYDDQRVWIVSCGSERPLSLAPLRPVGQRRQRRDIAATAGSLIILPSSYNTTHEHAVLPVKGLTGARYAVNAKHIPVARAAGAA